MKEKSADWTSLYVVMLEYCKYCMAGTVGTVVDFESCLIRQICAVGKLTSKQSTSHRLLEAIRICVRMELPIQSNAML